MKIHYTFFLYFFLLSCLTPVCNAASEAKDRQNEEMCIENAVAIIAENKTNIDRTGTFSLCLKAAKNDNPMVWYFVGYMQLNSVGAKANLDEGIRWLTKAGESGIASAQYELAEYYLTGGGVKQKIDMEKAIYWLSKLATNKNSQRRVDAAFRLCSIYLFGTNIEPDYDRAFTWCRISGIEHHNFDGLTNLALLYINGWGVPRNVPLAMDYYQTAARNNVTGAMLSLGRAYSIGQDVPVDYALAFQWISRAAEQKSPEGLYYLAQMYEYGQGTEQDENKSKEYYTMAAKLGESRAQYALGRIYQYSGGQNIDLAAKWYHKAAAQGNTDAMTAIGDLYRNQNQREMMRWYTAAAEHGSQDGMLRCIPYLLKGSRDIRKNPELALKYAKQLTAEGNSSGMYWLGMIYLNGYAGDTDPKAAHNLLSASAREGNADAELELGRGLFSGAFGFRDEENGVKHLSAAAENGCVNDACLELARYYAGKDDYQSAYVWLENLQNSITPENRDEYDRLLRLTVQKLSERKTDHPK